MADVRSALPVRTLPGVVPLDLGRRAPAAFAAEWTDFGRPFTAAHPGYAWIKPALLPVLVPQSTADALYRATQQALAAVGAVVRRRMRRQPADTLRALGYDPAQTAWLSGLAETIELESTSAFARADFVLGAEGARLVELNVGPTVGGLGILDRYAEAFDATVARLEPAWAGRLRTDRPGEAWARCLHRFASATATPGRPVRMALVVADDERAVPHPYEAAHFLRAEGIEAQVVPVGDVRFDGAVDLVYGCFTFDQFTDERHRAFTDSALAAQAAGGPSYLSAPLFTLLGNKKTLAWAAEELPAQVAETDDADAGALDRARAHPERYVLKPALGYGGKGVVIGATATREQWHAALESARHAPAAYVLQRYVPPVPLRMPTPSVPTGYDIGIGCIVFGGEPAGLLVRHVAGGSAGPINVAQGATFGGACVLPDDEVATWINGGTP